MDGRGLAGRGGALHRKAVADGLCLRLKGVYILDSLLWLVVDAQDLTAIGLSGALRVYTEDRKKVKRTATQEVEIDPVYAEPVGEMGGFDRRTVAVGFRPFVVGRGKRLVIEVGDGTGDRRIVLKVKGKALLKATRE
jgi:hypothetical protein